MICLLLFGSRCAWLGWGKWLPVTNARMRSRAPGKSASTARPCRLAGPPTAYMETVCCSVNVGTVQLCSQYRRSVRSFGELRWLHAGTYYKGCAIPFLNSSAESTPVKRSTKLSRNIEAVSKTEQIAACPGATLSRYMSRCVTAAWNCQYILYTGEINRKATSHYCRRHGMKSSRSPFSENHGAGASLFAILRGV